jgi:hypothetical protein
MGFNFRKKSTSEREKPKAEPFKSVLDELREGLQVLSVDDMIHLEGGKSNSLTLIDSADIANSFGGTIPL